MAPVYATTCVQTGSKTKCALVAIRDNASLLRSGVLFPFSTSCYHTHSLDNLAVKVGNKVKVERLCLKPEDVAPVVSGITGSERRHILRSYFETFYTQMFLTRRWCAVPAMTDRATSNLWRELTNECLMPKVRQSECKVSSTLLALSLPGFGDLSPSEIISLHRDSEAFAEWRTRLSSAIHKVQIRMEAGDEADSALKEELLPLHDAVRLMEKDIRGSSLRQLLIKNKTTVEIGAVAAFATAPILPYLGVDPSIVKDLLKVGSTAVITHLWSLLFGKPNEGAVSIANVYNKVFLRN